MFSVSVILPTYKPGSYIRECLRSLHRQTLDRSLFQVIIVLNGCDEPYHSELIDFIQANLQGMNVDFVQTDTPGVSNARNLGLQRTKGEYIAFVDDDDVLSEGYLGSLLQASDVNVVAICNIKGFTTSILNSSDYYISKVFAKYCGCQQIMGIQMRKFLSSACGKLIPAGVIGDHRFDTNLKNGEDSVFMLEISKNIRAMKCAPAEAVYYRRFREGSALLKRRSLRETTANYGHAICRSLALSLKHPFSYNHLLIMIKCCALVRSLVLALIRH